MIYSAEEKIIMKMQQEDKEFNESGDAQALKSIHMSMASIHKDLVNSTITSPKALKIRDQVLAAVEKSLNILKRI